MDPNNFNPTNPFLDNVNFFDLDDLGRKIALLQLEVEAGTVFGDFQSSFTFQFRKRSRASQKRRSKKPRAKILVKEGRVQFRRVKKLRLAGR